MGGRINRFIPNGNVLHYAGLGKCCGWLKSSDMAQLVYTPYYRHDFCNLTKAECVEIGWLEAQNFLVVNNLPLPMFMNMSEKRKGYCGFYAHRSKTVFVYSPEVAKVSLNPSPGNRQWSYPGYKVDRTGVGVVCHEVGHHIDFTLGITARGQFPNHIEKVSSYEPNILESIAETLRIFILNPCLLHIYAPQRCEFLINTVGLKPSINADWDEVLAMAPDRYREVVYKFILK